MSLLTLATLAFSAEHGWPELAQRRFPLTRIVGPLALLPPVVVFVAGTLHPGMFPPEVAGKSWIVVASAFLVTEIATLLLTGWLLAQVARTLATAVDGRVAYLIAALAPLPLWLSSLALLFTDLLTAIAIAALALLLSCGIIYHGLIALGRVDERVTAAAITHAVVGAVLVPWVVLAAVALAPVPG